MSKLLSANFLRLRKNKIFWIGIIVMALIGVVLPLNIYHANLDPEDSIMPNLEEAVFSFSNTVMVILSAFCGMFVGEEYSDGTIRNKIIVGHTRKTIYLSNLIVCSFAGVMMCIAYIIPDIAAGIPTLGNFVESWKKIVLITLCHFVMVIALAAIFTAISMLIQNKAVAAIVCIFFAFIMIFAGEYIVTSLNQTETMDVWHGEDDFVQIEEVPNPDYLRGTKRAIYTFFADFLPGGQAAQLVRRTTSHLSVVHLVRMMMYSLILGVASSGVGLIFFRKKDLN